MNKKANGINDNGAITEMLPIRPKPKTALLNMKTMAAIKAALWLFLNSKTRRYIPNPERKKDIINVRFTANIVLLFSRKIKSKGSEIKKVSGCPKKGTPE